MSKQMGFHPQIGSIITLRNEINQKLYVEKNYQQAIYMMIGFLDYMKPEDFLEELEDTLWKEYDAIENEKSIQRLNHRIKTNRRNYTRWFRTIQRQLWDKKYLENSKYGVETKLDTTFQNTIPWVDEQ